MRRTHSYSKRSTLDTCLRKYFYQYYASDKRCEFDEDRRALVRVLKGMSGSALVAGDIVHRMLALRFRKGREYSKGWVIETALRDFDRAVEFARDPRGQSHRLSEAYPPIEFVEFSHEDLDGEEEASRTRRKVERAIETYFESEAVRGLRVELARFDNVRAEVALRGLKVDGWAVMGKIDVLALAEGRARVVDWKLGTVERGMDSLQLYTYGRFAAGEAETGPEHVAVQRVFLGDGVVEEPRSVTPSIARRGHARLQQDIELMEELHEHGRRGDEEIFTPCDREGVCRRCQYRSVCRSAPLSERSNAISVSLPVLGSV